MKIVCVVGWVGILLSCVWGSIDSGAFAGDKPEEMFPEANAKTPAPDPDRIVSSLTFSKREVN